MSAVLELTDVFAGFAGDEVLHGVTLRVEASDVSVLFGLNGAGKSVTLKTIAGLVRARSGFISLNGREINGLESEDRVRLGLGYVPQTRRVFSALTVQEHLRLGGATLRDRLRRRRAVERVHALWPRLTDRRHQKAGALSGGEQAMLAICRALMADPKLILLDEPSAGLSPAMRDEVLGWLKAVCRTGTALLIVEQSVRFGLALANHVFVMDRGRVVHDERTSMLDLDQIGALLGVGPMLG